MTDATLRWPFPGSAPAEPTAYELPEPRFHVGDRVRTRSGHRTVCAVFDWPTCSGARGYNVHHDRSVAPPAFGHLFGEVDIEPLIEAPVAEAEDAESVVQADGPQVEMFA